MTTVAGRWRRKIGYPRPADALPQSQGRTGETEVRSFSLTRRRRDAKTFRPREQISNTPCRGTRPRGATFGETFHARRRGRLCAAADTTRRLLKCLAGSERGGPSESSSLWPMGPPCFTQVRRGARGGTRAVLGSLSALYRHGSARPVTNSPSGLARVDRRAQGSMEAAPFQRQN